MSLQRAVPTMLAGLAFCTAASAVTLNPRGLGQVLIYPYYTVNQGQDTLLTVVNTSDKGKIMMVRFLEGYNSRVVQQFLLYLSPLDTWTGTLTNDATGGGTKLLTRDTTCTYPAIPSAGTVFLRSYAGDGGPDDVSRTREGSIELTSVGDVRPGTATARRITHMQNGEAGQGRPPGCAELTPANTSADLDVPGDSAFGSGAIVNVGEGTFYPYNADAIAGFTDTVLSGGSPSDWATLQQANSAEATHGTARAYVFAGRQQVAIDYDKGEDAVSAVFMADSLYNEYITNTDLGATTDWIVTFPTKRYYTDSTVDSHAPLAPFTAAFAAPGRANVVLHADFLDQEEGFSDTYPPAHGCGFLCPSSQSFTLPYAVNAISILRSDAQLQTSSVFGSRLNSNLSPFAAADSIPPGNAGWIRLDLGSSTEAHVLATGKAAADGSPRGIAGLPATGFMVYNIINANAQPGKLANYSGLFPHRSTVACTIETPTEGTAIVPCE